MKRTLIALLIALFTFTACAESPLVGGWTTEIDETISQEAFDALHKATADLLGCTYKPVACLSSQLVAGRNYCVLCRCTAATLNAVSYYALVYIYADLEGNADITDIRPLDIAPLSSRQSDDGQNPIMNFVGPYFDLISQRATMLVECQGEKEALITISWANSAEECLVWRLSGEYDEETQTISYTNAVKTLETTAEDGATRIETIYENGSGVLTIADNWQILWQDDVENAGEGFVFEFGY